MSGAAYECSTPSLFVAYLFHCLGRLLAQVGLLLIPGPKAPLKQVMTGLRLDPEALWLLGPTLLYITLYSVLPHKVST